MQYIECSLILVHVIGVELPFHFDNSGKSSFFFSFQFGQNKFAAYHRNLGYFATTKSW